MNKRGVVSGVNNYSDIINLKHHVSKVHKQMNIEDRAAQFAPFSALTGYDKLIKGIEKTKNEEDKLK